MNEQEKLIPLHGGYRKLKSFQVAQLVYDVTVRFCDRYISPLSRTHDQMVQAARSGGPSGTAVSGMAVPKHATKPKNNRAFWHRKLSANKARDRLVNRTLRKARWQVLRIWEHELARKNEVRLLQRIRRALD